MLVVLFILVPALIALLDTYIEGRSAVFGGRRI